MSSGVTVTRDTTVTVLLLSHVLPRFFLLFLFSFLKITTCIASYFLVIGKHSFHTFKPLVSWDGTLVP